MGSGLVEPHGIDDAVVYVRQFWHIEDIPQRATDVHNQTKLDDQVILKEVRAGDRGRVGPRFGEMTKRQAAVHMGVTCDLYANFRINRPIFPFGFASLHDL